MEILDRINHDLDKKLFTSEIRKFEHACPACVYALSEEEQLKSSMLLCIDGNESQKRRVRVKNCSDNSSEVNERIDTRNRTAAFFLEPDEVDEFKDEVKKRGKQKQGRDGNLVRAHFN